MKKQSALKIVNICLFPAFLVAAVSMTIYRWGPENLRGTETVYQIHATSGILFFIFGIIHLILNLKWVASAYFKRKK